MSSGTDEWLSKPIAWLGTRIVFTVPKNSKEIEAEHKIMEEVTAAIESSLES